jgi:hypothetical protein
MHMDIIVTEYVTVTANQSSRLYNDMGLAVCESYLTQFVDPLKIFNLPTTTNDISLVQWGQLCKRLFPYKEGFHWRLADLGLPL